MKRINLKNEILSVVYWTIKEYGNSAGRRIFRQEFDAQSAEARGEFRARINGLKAQPDITGWSRINGFDKLGRPYADLGKMQIKANGIQHRPIGFFGPEQRTFTLLAWATERDWKFDPPNVRDTAMQRMKLILDNPELAYASDF